MPARHSREPAPTSSGFAITGGKSAGPDRRTSMSVIERASFRANTCYTLVLLDRLPSAERHLVGEVAGEAEPYGVLRPQPGSGLEYRTVSADTALLFLTLAEPGPVPTYVVAQLGGETEQVISRLVLDAVLEIEHLGGYLSGAKAGDVVMPGSSAAGSGRIGDLSRAALRYGQDLVGLPEQVLARRLYGYGHRPVPAGLRRRLSDEAALAAYLGLDPCGSDYEQLAAGWHEIVPLGGGQGSNWRRWCPRLAPLQETDGPSYKLYVSPPMAELKAVIATVASSLTAARGVRAFKVGFSVAAICRPDKMVVYFDRLDDLQAGASMLIERLDGCPAQGVPFTAEIARDGLLSWGADPPTRAAANGTGGMSWRMWVTHRLAEYLTTTGNSDCGELEPWEFALRRLRLSGIDTDTWVPANRMWAQILSTS